MELSYLVRGREVRVRHVEDVVAVPPHALSGTSSTFDESPAVQALPEADRKAFQRAGWGFLPIGASIGRSVSDVRAVYLSARERLLIDGLRLTVKWDDQRSGDEAKQAIEQAGLNVLAPLPFATNLFEVEVPVGRDSLTAAKSLSSLQGCRFAEPVLLQDLSGR